MREGAREGEMEGGGGKEKEWAGWEGGREGGGQGGGRNQTKH